MSTAFGQLKTAREWRKKEREKERKKEKERMEKEKEFPVKPNRPWH